MIISKISSNVLLVCKINVMLVKFDHCLVRLNFVHCDNPNQMFVHVQNPDNLLILLIIDSEIPQNRQFYLYFYNICQIDLV